jgi:uncharacterized protein with HEPN domain
MRDAIDKALRYTEGSSRQGLEDDEILRLAITKLVEIVGEAAKQGSEPTRNAHPSVPWSAAARMRDPCGAVLRRRTKSTARRSLRRSIRSIGRVIRMGPRARPRFGHRNRNSGRPI